MRVPAHLRFALYGLVFGFCLSRMGFADWWEVHKMFTFEDLRLFLSFCGGVAMIAVGYAVIDRRELLAPRKLHPGTLAGSALFGLGWAVTGACPSIMWVQLGSGMLAAIATLAGALFGTWIYPKLHQRYFGWDSGGCDM